MVWLHHIPFFIPKIFPELVWHKDRSQRSVYLTFDDGPVPGVTDFVLRQLEQRNMKATFFMVGDNVRKHPELAREVRAAGHSLGNHTFHHVNGSKTSLEDYVSEARDCQQILQEVTGEPVRIFRPPYGRITGQQKKALLWNMDIIMWDVLSGDFAPNLKETRMLEQTKRFTRNGSIVVFHDQQKTEAVLKKILPPYLDWVEDKGFQTAVL